MKGILKHLHHKYYLFCVLLLFSLLYPFILFFSKRTASYNILNKFRKWNGFLASLFSGIVFKPQFKGDIDWEKTYIVCANHSSNLDITALTLIMKNDFFFLGKEELLSNPVTALYFKTVDVPINRDSKIASYKALKKTADKLKSGISAIIFPEGKIGDEYPPILHSFKNGPFKLAIELKIPILPITIIDAWKIMWDDGKEYGSKPGICHICIHEPIETAHLNIEDDNKLRETTYSVIQSSINYNNEDRQRNSR